MQTLTHIFSLNTDIHESGPPYIKELHIYAKPETSEISHAHFTPMPVRQPEYSYKITHF